MNEVIVVCNFDCDSGMYNPETKVRYISHDGVYTFIVSNKDQFIKNLLGNYFDMSEKVYSAICNMMEFDYNKGILDLESGYYDFGNYSIHIHDSINRV